MRAILVLLLFLASCMHRAEDPVIAQMRVRAMQTRTFVHADAKAVTKEMITVLQDEGFMLKSVSQDLGVITAERDINIEKFSSKFWAYIFSGKRARWNKHSVIEMTSNVTEEQDKAKVRVNFLVRVFDNLGRVVDVHQILEEEAYVDFFNKVQKCLLMNTQS